MMFANRIGSSTGCSIWLPETSPPISYRGLLPSPFSKLQHFPILTSRASLLDDTQFVQPCRVISEHQVPVVLRHARKGVLDIFV